MENINQWKSEVHNYLSGLKIQIEKDEELKKICYGFSVIDGKIHDNPEIMFIGINSGSGNNEYKDKINIETRRISYVDILYTDDYYKYPLAQNTISYLNHAGFDNPKEFLEKSCVKTNCYYIDTKVVQPDLKIFKRNFKELYQKSMYFTVELIKLLKPKIVICEGKEVFDFLTIECERTKDYQAINGFFYFQDKKEKVKFVGFSRTFSNINGGNEAFGKFLKDKLK